jgi:hypothetical protein
VNLKRVRKIVLIVAVALIIVLFVIAQQGVPELHLKLLTGVDVLVWNAWAVMKSYERYTANLPELPDDVQSRVNENNGPRTIGVIFLICIGLLPVIIPSVPIMVSIIAALLLLVVVFWFFADVFWDTGQREALKKSLAS